MRKSTLIALSVFVALWVAAATVLSLKPERGMSRLSFVALDANQVDHVEITGPMPVDIKKEAGVWHLASGREADPDLLRNVFNNTSRAQSSDLLTEDINRFGEFEVDDVKGHHVKLESGSKVLAEFVVGKALSGGSAVRSGDAVYKVTGLFPGAFSHSTTDWLQRRLFSDPVDGLSRLNVRLSGQQAYNLQMLDRSWRLMGEDETKAPDIRFDSAAAASFVSALLNVRAQEILDQDPGVAVTKLGPDADSLTWYFKDTVTAAVGAPSHTLLLGATKDDKTVYARVDGGSNGRNDIYLLPITTANNLRKKVTDLRDLSLVGAVDVQHVTGLALNDGKHKVTFTKDTDGPGWSLGKGDRAPNGFELDSGKVQRRLTALLHLRSQGLAQQQSLGATGVGSARASATVTLDDKSSLVVAFGNTATDAPNTSYVRGTADEQVYFIGNGQRDMILGQLDTFKKDARSSDPLSQLDPATLNGLPPEVRANLQQQIAQRIREQQMASGAPAAQPNAAAKP